MTMPHQTVAWHSIFHRVLLLIVLLAVSTLALADDAGPIDPFTPSYILKLVVSLAVVLGLMFALAWLLKRFGRIDARSRNYPMKVLTQISVGPRERILLLEVGDRQMLVGVTQGGVEPLGWVDPPIDPIAPDAPQGFAQALQYQMGARFGFKKTARGEPRDGR